MKYVKGELKNGRSDYPLDSINNPMSDYLRNNNIQMVVEYNHASSF